MSTKSLSKADKAELDRLNTAVRDAVAARSKWLDAKMLEYAAVRVGGKIYDLQTGTADGKVIEIDRFRDHRRESLDTDMSLRVNYWWTTSKGGRFDTMSGRYGSLDERDESVRAQIAKLQKNLS